MIQAFAQAVTSLDVGTIITQVGWPGLVLWIVVRALDRIEHNLRGLSKAMWMDLAARPGADEFVKNEAKRMLRKLDKQPVDDDSLKG